MLALEVVLFIVIWTVFIGVMIKYNIHDWCPGILFGANYLIIVLNIDTLMSWTKPMEIFMSVLMIVFSVITTVLVARVWKDEKGVEENED
jgi:hypothetical protein